MTTFSEVERHTYDATGTLDEVATQFAGVMEAGKAEWEHQPAYDWDENDVITAGRMHVLMWVTMPVWTDYDAASAAAKAEWDRFYAALDAHEQGHFERIKTFYTDKELELVGKKKDEYEAWKQELKTRAQAISDAYDGENNHGKGAGTVITAPDDAAPEPESDLYTADPALADPNDPNDPDDPLLSGGS